MGLFTNVGGQLKELKSLPVNVGGELKELTSLTTNVGGQLKEIFNRTITFKGTWHKTSGVSSPSTMTPSIDTVVGSVTIRLPVKYTYYIKIEDGYIYLDTLTQSIRDGTMLNIGLNTVPKFVVNTTKDSGVVFTSTGVIEGEGEVTVNLHASRYATIIDLKTGTQTFAENKYLSFDYSFTFERI